MEAVMAEEIKDPIDNDVIKRIKLFSRPSESELQILKWVLQIKRIISNIKRIRKRARLVSALNLPSPRHSRGKPPKSRYPHHQTTTCYSSHMG